MLKYIWNLFFYSCRHEYEIIEIITHYYSKDGWYEPKIKQYSYIQKCKKCGKLHEFKTSRASNF